MDHYIAVDWAQRNMAIARMSENSEKVHLRDVPASVTELQIYLKTLKGSKILTLEESSTAQWLYIELKDYVDELVICDPYRNFLLSEGAKNDRIDATKLVKLLKANLLKPVFHSADEMIYLRKLASAYDDLVRAGVRWKNQRASLCLSAGHFKKALDLQQPVEKFILRGLDQHLQVYEDEKKRYEKEFVRLNRKHKALENLKSLPGIGPIHALKIASAVVDVRRFPTIGHFLSYCGLIKLTQESGGKSYGKKLPRHCRMMKSVFKMATFAAIMDHVNNPMRDYYLYLVHEKGYPTYKARHAVSRKLCTLSFGILKSGKKYEPERRIAQAHAA